MNKIVLGLVLGGILGILDGLTAWFTPAARAGIVGIVIGSMIKGLIAGVLIGFFARKVNSLALGIVFGWESSQWGGPMDYWLVKTGSDGPGIDGGILRYQDKMPRTINSVEVKSVDEYMEKATRNGGKVAKPKMSIPGVGYQAYFTDT